MLLRWGPGPVWDLMAFMDCACSLHFLLKVSSMFPPGQDAAEWWVQCLLGGETNLAYPISLKSHG